jgi:hypothetical protein
VASIKKFIDRTILKSIGSSQMDQPEEFTFENLDNADRIVVTTNLNQMIATVHDPEVIQVALNFVKSHPGGWTVPFDGVPIARLRLNFYAGDQPLGNVGVETTFLTVHQAGSFWSKTVDESERTNILAIIGLEDYDQA